MQSLMLKTGNALLLAGVLSLSVCNAAADPVVLIKDIAPGAEFTNLGESVAFGNQVFFVAATADAGHEIWKTDGTEGGTVLLRDIVLGPAPTSAFDAPSHLTVVGSTLFFFFNDGENGHELWKSDGTEEGTVLVKDILPGPESGFPRRADPPYRDLAVAHDGMFYFTATDGVEKGRELWRSNGTETGTVLVKDIYAGPESSEAQRLTSFGESVYFQAKDGIHGNELWKSDGTPGGTVLVADITPGINLCGPSYFTPFQGALFFLAGGLYKTDGTTAGNVLVSGQGGSWLAAGSDLLYLRSWDSLHGSEPWKSNGTAAGTVLIKDIVPGPNDSYDIDNRRESGFGFVSPTNQLLFLADDMIHGTELWVSDGTEAGTMTLFPGPGGGFRAGFPPTDYDRSIEFVLNETYFWATTPLIGTELWKTNGTTSGTVLVADINPGEGNGFVSGPILQEVGGTLIFTATDGTGGGQIWGLDRDEDSLSDLAETGVYGTDPDSSDTDDDGLSDGDELSLGTDPLVDDSDRDGIVDGSDPDVIADAVAALPLGVFANRGDPAGQRNAMLSILADIQQDILDGDIAGAIRALQNLKRRVDGSGPHRPTHASLPCR